MSAQQSGHVRIVLHRPQDFSSYPVLAAVMTSASVMAAYRCRVVPSMRTVTRRAMCVRSFRSQG